jgi:hypothetical protein
VPNSETVSFEGASTRNCVASTLRLSFRAITVFVFSRASAFSMRASSFVHGRLRVIFLPIAVPIQKCGYRISGHHNPKSPSMDLMVQCMMTGRFFSGTNTARKTERNTVALTM